MSTLQIRHVPASDLPSFEIRRDGKSIADADGRTLRAVHIPSPNDVQVVEGSSHHTLANELRWYLEDFLTYPFPPNDHRAERTLDALRDWGTAAFEALFDRKAGDALANVVSASDLPEAIQVESDDPRVLAWPWEALAHPTIGALAHRVRITRTLTMAPESHAVSAELPRDRINILLVTARPYERDVAYRSISRPLVQLIEQENLPAAVHILRPPTLQQLREHLAAHPNTYHLFHFDGHGGYGGAIPGAGRTDVLKGAAGKLVFEKEDGTPHEVEPDTLSAVLREHRIPAVVLNACQSATVDAKADDAFASVAAGLVQAGVRSVVAMGYSLYVSGAQRFLPAFYRRLFESGDLREAVSAGRQSMKADTKRLSAAGEVDLEDWLVPVHYHQARLQFSFGDAASDDAASDGERLDDPDAHLVEGETAGVALPDEGRRRGTATYDFVGRDAAIQAVERAMRRPTAGILIHGLGGVGKTTLAWETLAWLKSTGGLTLSPFWFEFDDIRSAEFVLDRLGVACYGDAFRTVTADVQSEDDDAVRRARLQKKVDLLVEPLKANPFVIVWDGFESASGIEGAGVDPLLGAGDRKALRDLLVKLRGGATKVLITSRSPEDWLGTRARFRLPLGGLQGEERWRLTRILLTDLGKADLQNDETVKALADALGGHPLAMQALFPRLESMSPQALLTRLNDEIAALDTDGEDTVTLFATLRFVEESVPGDVRDLLIPLSMHEQYVDADYLAAMCERHGGGFERSDVERLLTMLRNAGLVQHLGSNIYSVHPMLTSYLRGTVGAADAWTEAFVEVMAGLADHLAPKPLHEQRGPFWVLEPSFARALDIATEWTEEDDAPDERLWPAAALTQSLAVYAQNTRQWDRAETLFNQLAVTRKQRGDESGVAGAYHQLGIVAAERRDFAAAEQWYRKSLEVKERLGDEHGAARAYHQLGIVSEERRDFASAEQWYKKSLEVTERLGDEHGAAQTYHQLGMVSEARRDFAAAKQWYKKSLEVTERQGNEHGAAQTYHQLGRVSQERRDFAAAEQWYKKSLEVKERLGDEHGAAATYHQLGIVSQERRDFASAEQWYRKSLEVKERLGDEHGAALTYHHLGIVSGERRDFDAAEQWYRKSLEVKERLGDEYGAATTYHQLGILAALQDDVIQAGQWTLRGLQTFIEFGDVHRAQTAIRVFVEGIFLPASSDEREKLRAMSEKVGIPDDFVRDALKAIKERQKELGLSEKVNAVIGKVQEFFLGQSQKDQTAESELNGLFNSTGEHMEIDLDLMKEPR